MTKETEKTNEEETIKSLEELFPPIDEQPEHPGWVSVAEVLKKSDALFENMLFFRAYEFSSNIYILKGDYLTVVDPGNDYTAYMALFKRDEYQPADIKKIILTHGHRDHAMGVFELLRYPSINVKKEMEIIVHELGPTQLKDMVRDAGFPLIEIKGGETVELSGSKWEVIHTPGHTIDGISLYHAPTKTAFTGDTVLPFGMADVDLNAGGSLEHYLFGVKQLLKKEIENLLPGHGVPVVAAGKRVVEVTYESVMAKILDVEGAVAWMDGAPALAQRGLLEEAVYCCDKRLEGHPDDLTAMQLKAYCLTDMGRNEESLEVLDRILAEQSDNLHALLGKGHALLGLGRHEESIAYFDKVLKINPDTKEAQIYKGMALYFLGKYDEAMEIESFRTEFIGKFKQEIDRQRQAPKSDDAEQDA